MRGCASCIATLTLLLARVVAAVDVTALEDCHAHGKVQYCVAHPTGEEIPVVTAASEAAAKALPLEYTNCHKHGAEYFCEDPDGNEIGPIEALDAAHSATDGHAHDEEEAEGEADAEEEAEADDGSVHCHFHAGVEHCTGGAAESASLEDRCSAQTRSYNLPIRIGAIFIVMVTSAIAVFLPLILTRYQSSSAGRWIMMIVKQFGTGVIVSTAFIHLLTHAQLMFSSECVGTLEYEGTTSAICMAGIMIAFLVEFAGDRYIQHRAGLARSKTHTHSHGSEHAPDNDTATGTYLDSSATVFDKQAAPVPPPSPHGHSHEEAALHAHDFVVDDKLSVFVMEAGIIFHSILIGLTTVVAGDSIFATLLVVIIFHQAFEGLALGARISSLVSSSLTYRIMAALAFTLITPIGMAIGIGVRDQFNGNSKHTLIALGTLDAFSAGILVWVGVVEMWCHDWIFGSMRSEGILKTLVGLFALCAGMIVMSALGKWA